MDDVRLGILTPCFYFKACRNWAVMEKNGRCVCSGCSATLRGVEFPLRDAPWYPIDERNLAWQMEMPKLKQHSQR